MKSGRGDIFKVRADAICVTTNGVTRSDGRAVMGAGVARIAADRYPGIDKVLGLQIIAGGNHARVLHEGGVDPWSFESRAIVSLPTKSHWLDPSPVELVMRSAGELVELADERGWESVITPRPGCGLGGLDWEELKPALEEIWDDRFWVSSGP